MGLLLVFIFRVWNIHAHQETFQHLTILDGHTDWVLALAVSSDFLFSASGDNTVRIWNMTTLKHISTLTDHTSHVTALAFSDNLLFSGSEDNDIRVWKSATRPTLFDRGEQHA